MSILTPLQNHSTPDNVSESDESPVNSKMITIRSIPTHSLLRSLTGRDEFKQNDNQLILHEQQQQ